MVRIIRCGFLSLFRFVIGGHNLRQSLLHISVGIQAGLQFLQRSLNFFRTGLLLLYPYGLLPMVIFFVSLNIAWLVIWQWFAWRLTGLTFVEALKDTLPFLVFTLIVLGIAWWLTCGIESLWLLLLSRVLIVAVLYCGIMWLSGAKIMREAVKYFLKS